MAAALGRGGVSITVALVASRNIAAPDRVRSSGSIAPKGRERTYQRGKDAFALSIRSAGSRIGQRGRIVTAVSGANGRA